MLFVCNIFIAEDSCLKVPEISQFSSEAAMLSSRTVALLHLGAQLSQRIWGCACDFIVSDSEMVVIFLQKCLVAT